MNLLTPPGWSIMYLVLKQRLKEMIHVLVGQTILSLVDMRGSVAGATAE